MTDPIARLREALAEVDAVSQERDELVDQLASVQLARAAEDAIIWRAIVAMGGGVDPDDGPTGRWPCGTHVVDALIAERDKARGLLRVIHQGALKSVSPSGPMVVYLTPDQRALLESMGRRE